MAAPLGNQNASKAKQWAAAIERALERMGDPTINPDHPHQRSPRAKALDDMADKFIQAVLLPSNGMQGFKEFGDRLDGRVPQTLQGPDGESLLGPLVAAGDALRSKMR